MPFMCDNFMQYRLHGKIASQFPYPAMFAVLALCLWNTISNEAGFSRTTGGWRHQPTLDAGEDFSAKAAL